MTHVFHAQGHTQYRCAPACRQGSEWRSACQHNGNSPNVGQLQCVNGVSDRFESGILYGDKNQLSTMGEEL